MFTIIIITIIIIIIIIIIGDDIIINPPEGGIVKIVMKFGGSSLATADRITYVSKLIKKVLFLININIVYSYIIIMYISILNKDINQLLYVQQWVRQLIHYLMLVILF